MLAQNPGRIYEGKQHDITPTTPIVELLKEVQSLVKEIKGSKAQETLGQVAGKAIDIAAGAASTPL